MLNLYALKISTPRYFFWARKWAISEAVAKCMVVGNNRNWIVTECNVIEESKDAA